jgi:hypothetical protein
MEVWDADYIDLVVPGFLEFEWDESRLMGQFQFGAVVGCWTAVSETSAANRTSNGHGKVATTATPAAGEGGPQFGMRRSWCACSFIAETIQRSRP